MHLGLDDAVGHRDVDGLEQVLEQPRWTCSFAGNLTYPSAQALRDAAARIPLDRLMVETDAPYMTAEPYRGARNESAFVGWQARCMAEARGIPAEEMAAQLTANAERIYGIEVPGL